MLGKSRMMMAAVAGLALAMSPGAVAYARPVPEVITSTKKKRGLFNGLLYAYDPPTGRKGAGICMAQQKRASKKKRNQVRYKAARRR